MPGAEADGESELELSESVVPAPVPEDWLCASKSALRLSDEIWAVLKPETGDWADDAAELSPASERAPKKSDACDDDPGWGDVRDWIASSAAEAAPMAGSMA